MQSDFEKFISAYQAADQTVKNFIDSDAIGIFIDTLISNGLISPEQKQSLMVLVSNFYLGIITTNMFDASLVHMGLSFENSHHVHTYVISFLKQNGFVGEVSSGSLEEKNLQSEIQTAEREFASLHTVRTMPQDMAAIKPGSDTVYQSSQADILNQSAAPIPISEEPPRWDTETKQ